MELVLVRTTFTDFSTIGDLFIDGSLFCNTLELSCRRGDEKGLRAILGGRYKIIFTESGINKNFKPALPKHLPLVLKVPRHDHSGLREGIRFHPANSPQQLDGCISVGFSREDKPDFISESRMTFNRLFNRLVYSTDEIWIDVQGGTSFEGMAII